jgi:outer membrane immunogenic protein
MKTKIIATAALFSLAVLSSANAADLPMPAPVYKAPLPAPVYNWTGCYIGGGGGFGFWKQDSYTQTNPGNIQVSGNVTNGGTGWFGQGQGGCDYQFSLPLGGWNPNVVIGVFGDWEGGSIQGTNNGLVSAGRALPLSATETLSNSWAVGARAGYLVTPRFLTYFDGGFTQAHFDQANYNFNIPGAGGPSGLSLAANTYNGWFLGSGFEYSFDWLPISGLFLKTEFRYSQYGGNGVNVPVIFTASGAPTAFGLNSQKSVEMVSTELVWRFNWLGH